MRINFPLETKLHLPLINLTLSSLTTLLEVVDRFDPPALSLSMVLPAEPVDDSEVQPAELPAIEPVDVEEIDDQPLEVRRSHRQKKPPAWTAEYVMEQANSEALISQNREFFCFSGTCHGFFKRCAVSFLTLDQE